MPLHATWYNIPMEQRTQNRIVFMGTPDFAVPSLQRLHEKASESAWEVVGVATQPDRPGGRGRRMIASPVKQYAIEHNIPVIHPVSFRKDATAVDSLRAFAPDAIVVAAYGLILPKIVLELPTFGCINVHASLLPSYRGASPIAAAILDGCTETGVSIMLMDEGMDTGPVLRQAQEPIRADDTTVTLTARLADIGAELLVETLPAWFRGDVAPITQNDLPGEPSSLPPDPQRAGDDRLDPAGDPHRAHDPGLYAVAHGFHVLARGAIQGAERRSDTRQRRGRCSDRFARRSSNRHG